MPECTHDITFQKLDNSSQSTEIRVSPYSGGAHIQNAIAPAGWSVASSPSGVVFKPQSGGVIPEGSYPGFLIAIASNSQGHQYVLVEWMTAKGETICGQPLYVPCGGIKARSDQKSAAPDAPAYSGPVCGCLNAHTGTDDTSDVLDADIEVTIVQIVSAGFLKFNVLYTLDLNISAEGKYKHHFRFPVEKIVCAIAAKTTGYPESVPARCTITSALEETMVNKRFCQ